MQKGCAIMRRHLHELVGDVHEALLPHVRQAAPRCCYQRIRPAPSKPCRARETMLLQTWNFVDPFPGSSTELQATPNRKLHILGGQAEALFTMFLMVFYLGWQASGKGKQQLFMAQNGPGHAWQILT